MVYWFIAAALVLILELFVGTVYLLVVSAALFGAGLSVLFFGSHAAAVVTAALLSALGVWWANGWIRRRRRSRKEEAALNDLDIGQTVTLLRRLHGGVYEVQYRGTVWQARAENGAAQTQTAEITGKNGNFLIIRFI